MIIYKSMNTITKTIAGIFGMMMLLISIPIYAQSNIKDFNIAEQSILKKIDRR